MSIYKYCFEEKKIASITLLPIFIITPFCLYNPARRSVSAFYSMGSEDEKRLGSLSFQ